MKRVFCLLFLLASVLALSAVIHQVGGYNAEGWSSSDVCVSGNRAYISEQFIGNPIGFYILDVSNPAHPLYLGAGNDPNRIYGISVSGTKAYLAAGTIGFQVWDVSLPQSPVRMATISVGGTVNKLIATGDRLYVVVDYISLKIYDICGSTPVSAALPILLGTYPIDGICDVDVQGNLAYIATQPSGFSIVDISDPSACFTVGTLANSWGTYVRVRGNRVFLSNGHIHHYLIDVSTPSNPTQLYHWPDTWLKFGYFYENYLIMVVNTPGNSTKELRVYDISNAQQPSLTTTCILPCGLVSMKLQGNYLYTIDFLDHIRIYELSDLSNSLLISTSNIPYNATQMILKDDYVYIADSEHRLLQMDVSQAENPQMISQYSFPQTINDIKMETDLLYVTTEEGNFSIFRVYENEPPQGSNFELLSTINTGEIAYSVSIDNYRAYVGSDYNLKIINVVEPNDPMLLNTYSHSSISCYSIAQKYRNHLYLTGWTSPIKVLDVNDDFYPHIVGTIPNPSLAAGFAFKDDYLFQANQYNRIRVYNISNPASPFLAYIFPTARGESYCVKVYDHYLFVWYYDAFVIDCFDISNPASPVLAWNYEWNMPTYDLVYRQGLLYTCNGQYGFSILNCNPSGSDDPELTPKPLTIRSYPNPFTANTTISYEAAERQQADLVIYNLRGEAVRHLCNREGTIGKNSIIWDGNDDQQRPVSSGIYLARVTVGNRTRVGKLIRLK